MTFRTSAYYHYYQIDKSSFHDKVRYYEGNLEKMEILPFHEKIEVEADYLFALFEIGKYKKFLSLADLMIETVIMENIYQLDGRNIYEELLFNKAACYYNLGLFDKAIYICKELIKINPHHLLSRKLFVRSLKEKGMEWYEINKAIAVVFILSGISVILVEMLVVAPFYEQYAHHVKFFKYLLFSVAGALLIFNELWVRYQCYRHVNKHIGPGK